MGESTVLLVPRRAALGLLGCLLLLGSAACSDATDRDQTTDEGRPSTSLIPLADGCSVQNAIASLPMHTLSDDELYLEVTTADLNAATTAAGMERPADTLDNEHYSPWIGGLTDSYPSDGSPIFVRLADVFNAGGMVSTNTFREEVGWDLGQVDCFAATEVPKTQIAVLTGDFDESTFPQGLPEVADGVVTLGEGEDGGQSLHGKSAARPYGVPLRMSVKDGAIAAGESTPEVSAWHDGPTSTFADLPDFAALAAILDEANVVSAVLSINQAMSNDEYFERYAGDDTAKEDVMDFLPTDPFNTVGIGWATDDGEAVITVAIKFDTDDAASAAIGVYEKAFTEATSMFNKEPLSDLLVLNDATSTGSITRLTLSLGSGEHASPSWIYYALQGSDFPFIHQ